MVDLFTALQQGGEPAIKKLIDDRVAESVTLDFKLKSNTECGNFSRDDQAAFGRLLSGFANSAGGLGVWGVDARPGPDGLDCAQALAPINDIARFHSEAQTLCGQLLTPKFDGIRLAVVSSESNPGSGYLLVSVDRSDRRPHRCEASKNKGYFKRAGDSFFEMEHYDIEDAFARTSYPKLRVIAEPTSVFADVGEVVASVTIEITTFLLNISDVLCRFPYLQIDMPFSTSIAGSTGLPFNQEEGRWKGLFGGADHVIHPEQRFFVARTYTVQKGKSRDWEPHQIELKFRFGGLGLKRAEASFELGGDELRKLLLSYSINFLL